MQYPPLQPHIQQPSTGNQQATWRLALFNFVQCKPANSVSHLPNTGQVCISVRRAAVDGVTQHASLNLFQNRFKAVNVIIKYSLVSQISYTQQYATQKQEVIMQLVTRSLASSASQPSILRVERCHRKSTNCNSTDGVSSCHPQLWPPHLLAFHLLPFATYHTVQCKIKNLSCAIPGKFYSLEDALQSRNLTPNCKLKNCHKFIPVASGYLCCDESFLKDF